MIFRGVPEREESDSWEVVSRYLSEYLAKKLAMDLYEMDMQVSRAHHTPKSVYDNNQYLYSLLTGTTQKNIRKKLIGIHTSKKPKMTVSQMFSERLTNRRNQSLLRRKEIIKESPYLSVFLHFPAKFMGRKRHSREKYKLLEEF